MGFVRSLTCLALPFVMFASVANAGDVVRLKIADSLPGNHFLAKNGVHYFIEEVEKGTDGRVVFDYFPGQQLGKARELLDLTQSGVTDIGMVASAYVSEKMPLSTVFELPGSFDSSCAGTMAYWKLGQDGEFFRENEFASLGVRMLFAYVNPPYQLFLNHDFTGLDDLSGLKIRSSSGPQDLMLRQLGAAPVRTTATEVYESLSRGTVDGMVFPPPTALVYETQKFTKFMTKGENFGSVPVTYVINEKSWAKVPADLQNIILKIGERTTRRICEMTDQDTAESFGKFQEAGAQIISLNDADSSRLRGIFDGVAQDWIKKLEDRGKPAKAAYDAFIGVLN